jgi:hypothetical protein
MEHAAMTADAAQKAFDQAGTPEARVLWVIVFALTAGFLFLWYRGWREADECEKKHELCEQRVLELSVRVARLEPRTNQP